MDLVRPCSELRSRAAEGGRPSSPPRRRWPGGPPRGEETQCHRGAHGNRLVVSPTPPLLLRMGWRLRPGFGYERERPADDPVRNRRHGQAPAGAAEEPPATFVELVLMSPADGRKVGRLGTSLPQCRWWPVRRRPTRPRWAGREELDLVGDDVYLVASQAILAGAVAALQSAAHEDEAALAEVLSRHFGERRQATIGWNCTPSVPSLEMVNLVTGTPSTVKRSSGSWVRRPMSETWL
jgi:hypothetical protein